MTAVVGTALRARLDAFTFHGENTPALCDVAVSVLPGSLTAVLGGSGSGKSTLGKLLAGWLRAGHAGQLRGSLELGATRLNFRGLPEDPRINPAEWSRRVAFVPQDAAAMLSTVRATVAEELAFGLENRAVPREDMFRAVERTAARTGLTGLLDRDPATLSGGELRRLAVACAVIAEPDILILDEPLASLDAAGAEQIRDLVRSLCGAGSSAGTGNPAGTATGVVLLSQAADTLAREAAHWTVLDGGTVTAAGAPAQLIGSAELERAGVLGAAAVRGHGPVPAIALRPAVYPPPSSGPAPLELRGVGFSYGLDRRRWGAPRYRGHRLREQAVRRVLQNLDLTVRPGEIIAVTGPNGAGKSTLLRHINGLLRPSEGDVRVCGRSIAGVPVGTVAASVGLLFQHPRDQLFERTVLREAAFGLRQHFGKAEAEYRARAALAAVGFTTADEAVHPAELSASQQRLLALATVLAREPAVLALDEPTVGLDRRGLERLDRAVSAAAARGTAVVLVTHDLAYARATAHRVLELDGGTLRDV
ncbi:ABC transporter ATP-binding protein [Arthrobacter sp. ov118]|uniref:ABC transporter ATP-binding protein n=1 Tax=Arthrobacter sp. ov118 TaxID=1761747 RepID=UPI0008EE7D9D|nr:ABC transporter ATP-binding protein [Arthrobacter sp. ov118]SFU08091.1 energy-coupling factor transport system ATP-binding protein [Arthrobacter sp. ov118]